MGLFRTSILVVLSCTVMSVQAANFNNSSGKTNSTRFTNKIPEGSSPTLKQMQLAYLSYYNKGYSRPGYLIEPAGTPVEIKASISKDEKVTRELRSTGLMSYLLYRQGQLVVDEISPSDRLGKFITNDTPFNSQSIGKSLTSYLLGHAICRGYVTGLDQTIADWPLMKGTPFENQLLSNLVNMRGGDSKLFKSSDVKFKNSDDRKGVNDRPISYWAKELQGKRSNTGLFSDQPAFNYSGFVSNLVLNYIRFKTQDNFNSLLEEVFNDKVGIANPVKLGKVDLDGSEEDGLYRGVFFASRYDYLRLAIAILNDWQSGNCVGRYLQGIYENRVTGLGSGNGHGLFRSKTHGYGENYDYAGFFHTNPSGAKGTIFEMHGYGGQSVAINFDTGTIAVAHSVHEDWDTASLIIDAVNQ